jgi:hypothetical protein
VAVDGATEDTFQIGDVFEVSPNVAILLTAARWVRVDTRAHTRRKDADIAEGAGDRRHVSDRRHTAERSA